MEGSQALSSMDTKFPKVLSNQPKAETPFIDSPHENRAVIPLHWA